MNEWRSESGGEGVGRGAVIELMSGSVDATVRLGRALAGYLQEGDVVALRGNLGAGKTQLVRGVAEGLGVDGRGVSSPTFVLVSEYEGRLPVVHMDAYRMEGLSDVESVGFNEEMLAGAVTLIEWAERVEADLPSDRFEVMIDHVDESERRVVMRGMGGAAERIGEMRKRLELAVKIGKCPTCGGPAAMDGEESPFCSKRCKGADLNKWFNGDYMVSRPISEADEELT